MNDHINVTNYCLLCEKNATEVQNYRWSNQTLKSKIARLKRFKETSKQAVKLQKEVTELKEELSKVKHLSDLHYKSFCEEVGTSRQLNHMVDGMRVTIRMKDQKLEELSAALEKNEKWVVSQQEKYDRIMHAKGLARD